MLDKNVFVGKIILIYLLSFK